MDLRKKIVVYDWETYLDYAFVCTQEYEREDADSKYKFIDGTFRVWRMEDRDEFAAYHDGDTDDAWVAFNNRSFDDALTAYFKLMEEPTDAKLRALSDIIIKDQGTRRSDCYDDTMESVYREIGRMGLFYGAKRELGSNAIITKDIRRDLFPTKTVDIRNILVGGPSLKQTAITLHSESIMESPVGFDELVGDRRKLVEDYCETDLNQTFLAYSECEPELKVRDTFFVEGFEDGYLVGAPKLAETVFLNACHFRKGVSRRRGSEPLSEFFRLESKGDLTFQDEGLSNFYTETFLTSELRYATRDDKTALFNMETGDPILERHQTYNGIKELIQISMDDDFKLNFGLGGAHSAGGSRSVKCADDEIIYNVDVKSYYPSMIVQFNISPKQIRGLPDKMGDILTERFKNKAAGKKVHEQAQKLLMNSTFGKFNDKYSKLFDPKATYSVTITGQILLYKLLDMVKHHLVSNDKLYDPINVNTDGLFIRVKKSDVEDLIEISKLWEKMTGVDLDAEFFTEWHQLNVNNYFALQDNGYIKGKGDIGNVKHDISKAITYAYCVKKAVQEYLINGIPLEDTIAAETDIRSFIMMERNNSGGFVTNDELIDYKMIRAVYASNGHPLFKTLREKHHKLLGGEKVKVVLRLSESANIDIDYNKYIDQAYGLVYNMKSHEYGSLGSENLRKINAVHVKQYLNTLVDLIPEQIGSLKHTALNLVPKNLCKINYTNVNTELIPVRSAAGFGVRCDNVYSIDIDSPEHLDPELKRLLERYPTLKSWHGEDEVLNGGKGCFIYYKVGGKREFAASSKMVESHGFEILSGTGKIQSIGGVHPKGDIYTFEGEVTELPNEIYTYLDNLRKGKLLTHKPKVGSKGLKPLVSDTGGCIKSIVGILKEAKFNVESPVVKEVNGNNLLALGFTDGEHSFTVFVNKNNSIGVSSYHSSWLEYSGLRDVDWKDVEYPGLITLVDVEKQYQDRRKWLGL